MYEEDNEIQGENDDDGKLNNFKEGSAIEGDVTDGEASGDKDDTDGETRDGDKEYCPKKGNDTDSEESYDEEDIVMQDKGRYKKENEAMANTGRKRITKEKVEENRKPKKERKRAKKPCPVPRCGAKVVHLPKHLRNVHKWTTESSRLALTRFKLRKKYTFVSQETASAGNRRRKGNDKQAKNPKIPNRKRKLCPFSGCMVFMERLPQHLQRRHKLKREDPRYNKILSQAKVVSNVVEDKELSSNSGSEFSFLNSHGPTEWKDDGDKSSALLAEHNLTEISSLATTNTSQNGDVEYAGCETKILKQFCDWLVSPDGEQNDKKTATQHVSQLKRVMSVTGGGPASLVDKKKIRDVFLPQAKDKYYAATIKSYLMSLQHCSFLREDKPSGVDYDRDDVTDLRGKLKKKMGETGGGCEHLDYT